MAGEGGGYSPLSLFLFPLRYPKEKGKFQFLALFLQIAVLVVLVLQWNVVT